MHQCHKIHKKNPIINTKKTYNMCTSSVECLEMSVCHVLDGVPLEKSAPLSINFNPLFMCTVRIELECSAND